MLDLGPYDENSPPYSPLLRSRFISLVQNLVDSILITGWSKSRPEKKLQVRRPVTRQHRPYTHPSGCMYGTGYRLTTGYCALFSYRVLRTKDAIVFCRACIHWSEYKEPLTRDDCHDISIHPRQNHACVTEAQRRGYITSQWQIWPHTRPTVYTVQMPNITRQRVVKISYTILKRL